MSLASSVKTVLNADGTLTGLLTGGIYTWGDTGRLGINRDSTPSAFDTTSKLLKPCALVKQRSRVPDGQIIDVGSKHSEVIMIEVWLYTTGSSTPPDSAAAQVYSLLRDAFISSGRLRWSFQLEDFRDPEMDRANVIRLDFEYKGIRS